MKRFRLLEVLSILELVSGVFFLFEWGLMGVGLTLIAMGLGVIPLAYYGQPSLEVSVKFPEKVRVGDSFDIELNLMNRGIIDSLEGVIIKFNAPPEINLIEASKKVGTIPPRNAAKLKLGAEVSKDSTLCRYGPESKLISLTIESKDLKPQTFSLSIHVSR